MPGDSPPTLDPIATDRWSRVAPTDAPWLHEEVARRMADRLEWIKRAPDAWVHWEPLRGGLQAQAAIEARYDRARSWLVEPLPARLAAARRACERAWWQRWSGPARTIAAAAPDGQAGMLWANMALHATAQPQALMGHWHRALATNGFLMFSCFGPDTLRELHAVYGALGWPPPGPRFTDMHDWGDMLVAAGFGEPVMDMERITLTWASADALLAELRGLGRNLHPGRFPALRGRGWRDRLGRELSSRLAGPDGRLALTFEIVYGHAIKPPPRARMGEQTALSVDDMRALLQAGRRPAK